MSYLRKGLLSLSLVALLVLTACGNSGKDEEASSSLPSATASESASAQSPSASAVEPSEEASETPPSPSPSESAPETPSESHGHESEESSSTPSASASESPSATPSATPKLSPKPAASPSPSASEDSETPAASASDEPEDKEKSVVIEIKDFAFSPAEVTISKGTTVTFINKDKVKHTATADEGEFDTGLFGKDESMEVKLEDSGTFAYYCAPHPGMTGKIIVE